MIWVTEFNGFGWNIFNHNKTGTTKPRAKLIRYAASKEWLDSWLMSFLHLIYAVVAKTRPGTILENQYGALTGSNGKSTWI